MASLPILVSACEGGGLPGMGSPSLEMPAGIPSERLPLAAVVQRMRGNMRRMEVPEIDDAEAATIARYLQRAAGEPP